ncbi:glycosyltransferase [uncultured Marinococcus sp.]|uniref:glycosyltransferase n=1 Tax=uncultured Marinococcus sp. TaxID=487012 RepID=UPI002629D8FD|nr:glycosyltransferase [uncultured Marinococcus sp.]
MEKKKILFVVNNFNIGGPQKSLLSLLYKINFDYYEVSILSLSAEGKLMKHLPNEVSVITPDSTVNYAILAPKIFIRKTIKFLLSSNFKLAFKAILTVLLGFMKKNMTEQKQKFWVENKKKLPKLNQEFDVAIGVSGGHSIMFVVDCVRARKKIGWIRSDYRVLKRNVEIDRPYFQTIDSILSVSHLCKNIFLSIFPETEEKIIVMYNVSPFKMYRNIPVNTKSMKKSEETTNLLTICRLDPNKGLDLAIEALEILVKKNNKVVWYVLGEGSYRKKLEKMIYQKGLQNYFILLGAHLNTGEFIKNTDILVHPSRFEGKSNVIDEAKQLLKPIVATNFETVHEQIVHEKTGLISNMNARDLAKCILRVKKEDYLVQKFKRNLAFDMYDDTESLNIFQKIIEE